MLFVRYCSFVPRLMMQMLQFHFESKGAALGMEEVTGIKTYDRGGGQS